MVSRESQAVETAMRTYLWPTPPGGIDHQGWALGRTVRSLELEVIVSQVPGVVEINGLNLFTPRPPADTCRSQSTRPENRY